MNTECFISRTVKGVITITIAKKFLEQQPVSMVTKAQEELLEIIRDHQRRGNRVEILDSIFQLPLKIRVETSEVKRGN